MAKEAARGRPAIQDGLRVERLIRRDEGNWLLSDHAGVEAAIDLASLGCRLELARVYDKADL
ncbi:MAG TPA: hypothetical protein VF100_09670 [Thermoanaerobaculia bacterium]